MTNDIPRARDWPSAQRRRLFKFGIAGASLFLPSPFARLWAQTPQGSKLLKLPKVALVIGNSRYPQSPLKNPVNDARAFGEALLKLGFDVSVRLDADRAAMNVAIAAHVDRLAKQQCVGLFYYAGHGLQMAWKNYLLPVDASIAAVTDVHAQGVELNALIAGLTRAANPLNLIILDACRDNPFGSTAQLEQKGLSQMDAPLGTLLAYATSPGNTASDGEGANGLYTENLLKEIQVREAKVEDVFKRVRLGVRRGSKGLQIPWESTSLEDDFYFLPPGTLARPGDDERARRFAEEFKLWESIQEAASPAPFESYLRKFPSGQFSELAQLQLDRLLAKEGEKPVRIAPAVGNPYTAGSARADTRFQVGDTWTWRVSDRDSGAEKRRRTVTVSEITDQEVRFNNGRIITDLLGNIKQSADGRRYTGNQMQPLEFAVGRQWTTRFELANATGNQWVSEYTFRITTREKISVPAGTFDCFRIEGKGISRPVLGSGSTTLMNNFWMAPDVCRHVIKQEINRTAYGPRGPSVIENNRFELLSFKQA